MERVEREYTESFGFPEWLNDLFIRFSVIYEGLWTFNLKTDAEMVAKKLEWYGALAGFAPLAIRSAVNLARDNFEKPPSIKEFIELCQSETRRLKPEGLQLEDQRRPPPSPLLAEYMAKNPRQPDDPFKLLFAKYKGKELGSKVIAEIKNQLANKILEKKK